MPFIGLSKMIKKSFSNLPSKDLSDNRNTKSVGAII